MIQIFFSREKEEEDKKRLLRVPHIGREGLFEILSPLEIDKIIDYEVILNWFRKN
jgi:hypothetical protein